MKKCLLILLIFGLLCLFSACDNNETAKEPPLMVGFLYAGPINDGGLTEAQDRGRQTAYKNLGGDSGRISTIYVEDVAADEQSVRNAAEILFEQGAQVLIGCSGDFATTMVALAEENPDRYFFQLDGPQSSLANFSSYTPALEYPSYLTGMVAGMLSQSNKIGYLAANPETAALIQINAFTLGARSVNANAEIRIVYTYSQADVGLETSAAETLLASGCDVLAQQTYTTAAQSAAAEAGAYYIGYLLDTRETAPEAFLLAPLINFDVFYFENLRDILDNKFQASYYYGDLSDAFVDITDISELVPAEIQAKVNEVKARMEAGQYPVFQGPLLNNLGEEVVAADETLDRAAIWQMDYLVDGAGEWMQ